MRQEFYINAMSTLPVLRMELINDGRYDFNKIYEALQDADIKFSMKNEETGVLKVSNADAVLRLEDNPGCEERLVIEYDWKARDTKTPGVYKAWFDIDFHGNITQNGINYPNGKMIVPIQEDLIIYVK